MGKGKRIKRERKEKELSARKRAEIIFSVRGGLCSASDGAAELGVSRKTFYQWENKALAAMAGALEEKDAGRPEQSDKDKEIAELKGKLAVLEKEREDERRQFALKEHHLKLQIEVEASRMKKKSGGGSAPGKGRLF